MSLIGALPKGEVVMPSRTLTSPWLLWFSQTQIYLQLQGLSGTTADRPIYNTNNPNSLYVGLQYFDTTLGLPVFCKTVNPTEWVNASGTTV